MEIRDFSPEDYAPMVEIHRRVNIVWPERPQTAEAWAEADRGRSPRYAYHRWAAVEEGRVVGFSSFAQSPWNHPPGSIYINVEVDPACQRRGIGSALYDAALAGALPFQPPALRADAFSNLPRGFDFLQKRGFYEAFRETPVHLEVAHFDARPYAEREASLNAKGIFIRTLAELESDPERDRKLYELSNAVEEDLPHEGGPLQKPDFEDWVRWLRDPSTLRDAYLVAVHGDEYVGLRDLADYSGGQSVLGGLMGVRREYRGLGIALVMLLRNIAYAQEHGYCQLKDCTAVVNAPMQSMFTQLGFTRDPEWQQCQKDLS